MKKETAVIHGGISEDSLTGAVSVPIYQTSTYRQTKLGQPGEYEYSRSGNPSRTAVEKLVSDLEHAYEGFAFASGLAALHTVLSHFGPGDHIILSLDVYGGTYRQVDKILYPLGITYSLVDMTQPELVEAAIVEETTGILFETPTNPLLTIIDIKTIADIAHRNHIWCIVDNTFATPYLQHPHDLGADIVIHSGTKYLGGHSDVVSGFVTVNAPHIAESVSFNQNAIGGVLGPQDAWLTQRGIKTLAVRMNQHNANAQAVAEHLEASPHIAKVLYPGLPSHPQHEIAKKQMDGFGGMVSFELSDPEAVAPFVESLKVITLAESLGGVESLIEVPAVMTHASIPLKVRAEAGISDGLVRFSVGIEHIDDLIQDLDQALATAYASL